MIWSVLYWLLLSAAVTTALAGLTNNSTRLLGWTVFLHLVLGVAYCVTDGSPWLVLIAGLNIAVFGWCALMILHRRALINQARAERISALCSATREGLLTVPGVVACVRLWPEYFTDEERETWSIMCDPEAMDAIREGQADLDAGRVS